MTSTRCLPWVALAFMAGVGEARAEIPYSDQITPGVSRGIALREASEWNMGYWEYLPSDFDPEDETRRYPMLVFLAGLGMSDDISECPADADVCSEADCWNFQDGLCRNLRRGPQRLMWEGEWDDELRPFIHIMPQNNTPTNGMAEWDPDVLDAFLVFVLDNYPIDPRRIYLMGMSQGGRGVLQYTSAYPRRFTAVAPAPGGGVEPDVSCHFQDTAFWAFHGENDADAHLGIGVFDPCWMARQVAMYNHPELYAGQFPRCAERAMEIFPDGRMTMFYGVAHNAWDPAYDPIGIGFNIAEWTSDEFCNVEPPYRAYSSDLDSDGVYSWFLSLDRPDVVLPEDYEVTPGDAEIVATIEDDDDVEFTWTQIAGPEVSFDDTRTATLRVTDLELGQSYTFDVLAVDADGQWDRDDVVVTVVETPGEGSTGGGEGDSEGDSAGEGGDGVTDDDAGSEGSDGSEGGKDPSTTTAGTRGGDASESELDDQVSCNCDVDRSPRAPALLLFVLAALRRRTRLGSSRTPK